MRKEQEAGLRRLAEEENKAVAALRTAQGRISIQEFVEAFQNALPATLKEQLEKYGYVVTTDPEGSSYRGGRLYVSRHVLIGKYMQNLPFVYQEYDGALFKEDNAETHPLYNKYINTYKRPLQD